jgi:acetoin utilization deacetylase AcuC-like enzyme
MKVVHTGEHRRHAPRFEVQFGERLPHFETPERVDAILGALQADGSFEVVEPSEYGRAPIDAVHEPAMVDYLETAWEEWRAFGRDGELVPHTVLHPGLREGMGPGPEPDTPPGRLAMWCFETMTPIVEGTYAAARAAVDVALTGADLLLAGEPVVYALTRPPGHHAARAVFGGYCYLNNAAIAAEHLRRASGQEVVVLDLDYHHGNGTQQIFYGRADVVYVSLHGDPRRAFPYLTGYPRELGTGQGIGSTLNFPLAEGTTDDEYLATLDRALDAISSVPGMVLVVSLGLDTLADDPITDLAVTVDVQDQIGRRVAALGRAMLVVQEGGYHVPSLGEAARRWLRGASGLDV